METRQTSEENIPEEFFMDDIIYITVNKSRRKRHVKYGKQLFKKVWNEIGPEEDTWEPTRQLPCSKIISVHQKRKELIPSDIEN